MEKKDLHNLIDTIKTNFDRMIHDSIKSIDNYIDKEEENKIPEPEKGMWCYFWDDAEYKGRWKLRYLKEHNTDYYNTDYYSEGDNKVWDNCELCHDQWLPAKYKGIIRDGDLFIINGKGWTPIRDGHKPEINNINDIDYLSEADEFLIIHREES